MNIIFQSRTSTTDQGSERECMHWNDRAVLSLLLMIFFFFFFPFLQQMKKATTDNLDLFTVFHPFALLSICTFTNESLFRLMRSEPHVHLLYFPFTAIFAHVSCLSCYVTWTDSSGFWMRFQRRSQRPRPAEATTQGHRPRLPSSQHPSTLGICQHWISVLMTSLSHSVHGSLPYGCWVYKSFPA